MDSCHKSDTNSDVPKLQEVQQNHLDDIIDSVAKSDGVDEGLHSNELLSSKEEYAPVPNPFDEHPEQEVAHENDCSNSKESTPRSSMSEILKMKLDSPRKDKLLKNKPVKLKRELIPKNISSTTSFAMSKKVRVHASSSQEALDLPHQGAHQLQLSEIPSQQSDGLLSGKAISKHRDPRLEILHLQRMRCETGIWVQCVSCDKWRYLATVNDVQSIHPNWKCSMNSDLNFSSCRVEQVGPTPEEEEFMVHCSYTAGSLVWAQITGYPWWPAMVDDDPDFQQFYWLNDYSDIPTYYNVVFFDSQPVTRSWITPHAMKPFSGKTCDKVLWEDSVMAKNMKKRWAVAVSDAERAATLDVSQRLQEFSFVSRYLGKLGKKRKKTSRSLRKMKKIKKQLFKDSESDAESPVCSDESSLCSEESYQLRTAQMISLSQETTSDNLKSKSRCSVSKKKPTNLGGISSQSSSDFSDEDSTNNSSVVDDDDDFKYAQDSANDSAGSSVAKGSKNNGKWKSRITSKSKGKTKVSVLSENLSKDGRSSKTLPDSSSSTDTKTQRKMKQSKLVKNNISLNKNSELSRRKSPKAKPNEDLTKLKQKSLPVKEQNLYVGVAGQQKSSQDGQISISKLPVSSSTLKNKNRGTEDDDKLKNQGNKSHKNVPPAATKAKFSKCNFVKPEKKVQPAKDNCSAKNAPVGTKTNIEIPNETNKIIPVFQSVKKQKKCIIKADSTSKIGTKPISTVNASEEKCEASDIQECFAAANAHLSSEKALGEMELTCALNLDPDSTKAKTVKSKKYKVSQFTVPKNHATDETSQIMKPESEKNIQINSQKEVPSISQEKKNPDGEVKEIDNIEGETSSMETSLTLELPQQQDPNKPSEEMASVELPSCSDVIIEDVLASLSQENLNYFRSSSPLFDMEE